MVLSLKVSSDFNSLFILDLLLIMFEVSAELQNKVSLLCESWWSHQLKDRDQVIQNTILYVVLRSVGEGAAVSRDELVQ